MKCCVVCSPLLCVHFIIVHLHIGHGTCVTIKIITNDSQRQKLKYISRK